MANLVNLHIYPSPFKYETRMLKEAKSIIKFDLVSEILILSTGEKGLPGEEMVSDRIKVKRINTFSHKLFSNSKIEKVFLYLEFYLRGLIFGLTQKVDIINCHSLMVLPMSVILKGIKLARLIYDPHELETERLGLKGFAQQVSKTIEKTLIYYCDEVIVVSDSIKSWYEQEYGLTNVSVVRNIPNFTQSVRSDLFRQKFGIPPNHLICIYQGLINEGRSIDLYLNAFSKLPAKYHLVIMGYGALEGKVKEFASRYENIHFQPAVKPSEILAYSGSADIGLTLIENCCLSYYYCLPNKFFEYVMAELPVIVSDFPDMASLVRLYDIGWAVAVDESDLSSTILSLDETEVIKKRENLKQMKQEFRWEKEENEFIEIYKRLLPK